MWICLLTDKNAYVIVEYFRTAGNLSSIEFGKRSKEDTLKFYNGLIAAIYNGTEEVELFEGEEIKDVYVPEIEAEVEPVQNEYGVFVDKDDSYYNEEGELTDEYGHLLNKEENIIEGE